MSFSFQDLRIQTARFLLGCCGPGKLTKRGKSPKVIRGGCKRSVLTLLGQGAKVSQESFAPPKPSLAPVQPHFALVQEASRTRGPKDLLHPLLTTFGNFHFSGTFPGPQHPKAFSIFAMQFSSVTAHQISSKKLRIKRCEGIR